MTQNSRHMSHQNMNICLSKDMYRNICRTICNSPKLEITLISTHNRYQSMLIILFHRISSFYLPFLTATCPVTRIRLLHINLVSSLCLTLKLACFIIPFPTSPAHCRNSASALVSLRLGSRLLNQLTPTAYTHAILLYCSYPTLLKPEYNHFYSLFEI